jgi:MFS transporter, DHA1 family, inner membrane transport protein
VLRRLFRTEVAAAVAAVLLARTAVNGGYRIVYPFLPEIARGLEVSLATIGLVLALRAALGLAAPAIPLVAEAVGRRAVMLGSLAASVAGCLIVAGARGVAVAGVGLAVAGVAKPAFDIPMQGWFGARVPYGRRGRVLGVTELTWALSLALALPAGFLIAATSWRAPFVLVAVLSALGLVAVAGLMASDRPPARVRRPLRLTRPLVGILVVALLFRFAAESLFIVYATWLESDFGLSVAAIGVFTLVVVGAELAGEGSVAAFADRVGLKRAILIGLLGTGGVYASLGLVGDSLLLAVVAVVGWFALFEITIVATIPFVTELAAEARDRLLALLAASAVASGGVAALVAPRLYAAGGIALCGLVAAGAVLVGAVVLATAVPAPAAGARRGQ